MIIGKYFDGDNYDELKMHQHSCYEDLLQHWLEFAGRKLTHYWNVPEWQETMQKWRTFRESGAF